MRRAEDWQQGGSKRLQKVLRCRSAHADIHAGRQGKSSRLGSSAAAWCGIALTQAGQGGGAAVAAVGCQALVHLLAAHAQALQVLKCSQQASVHVRLRRQGAPVGHGLGRGAAKEIVCRHCVCCRQEVPHSAWLRYTNRFIATRHGSNACHSVELRAPP